MGSKRRRIAGFFPQVGRWLWASIQWGIRHPQPAVCAALLALMLWAVTGYTSRAEAFRITKVLMPADSALELPVQVLGINIWSLDLRLLADELKRQQPWLKDIRVVRELPNAIRIDAVRRVPIAQVKLDRWYPMDREGFILPDGVLKPADGLVRLVGLNRDGERLRAGKEHAGERVQLGLRLVQRLRRHPASSRRLTEISVADPEQITLRIDDGTTEVRCGSETELDAQLARLQVTLREITRQSLDAAYIDVRFDEPVVSPRT